MRSTSTTSAFTPARSAAAFPWMMVRVTGFCLLIAAAAQVRIPVPGSVIPMTLQLLAVLAAGLTLGPVEAAASVGLYVLCGAAGLPVFSPASAGLWGPTGGYLLGFVLAAMLMPLVRGRGHAGLLRLLLCAAVGVTVVLIAGLIGLTVWTGGDWRGAAEAGVAPFAVKAVVEVFLAVGAVRALSLARTFRSADG